MTKIWIPIFFSFFLSACVSQGNLGGEGQGKVPLGSLGQRVADSIVTVPEEHRALRVCLLSAGAIEVMTDLAQQGGGAELYLGKLMLLQNAIDKSRASSALWKESDLADVALLFAHVLKDAGKSRLAQILLGGPTIANFAKVAERTVILSVKGNAVIRDINNMLSGVKNGTLSAPAAWEACELRIGANRQMLMILNGA